MNRIARTAAVVVFFAGCLSVRGVAQAENPPAAQAASQRHGLVYQNASRVLPFRDGSEFVIANAPIEAEPGARTALLVSAKGEEEDRAFSVANWIPRQVAAGTKGQIYSAAMAENGRRIAIVAGWRGAQDERGHNGVFILELRKQGGHDDWRLQSWFDVAGSTIGEIEFGPDDTLIVASHDERDAAAVRPLVTLYTYTGVKLGAGLESEKHANFNSAAFARRDRIARVGDAEYAFYDIENGTIRRFSVRADGKSYVIEEKGSGAAVARSDERFNVVAFSPTADGDVVLGRVFSAAGATRTEFTRFTRRGNVVDTVTTDEPWIAGYFGPDSIVGFRRTPDGHVNVSTLRMK